MKNDKSAKGLRQGYFDLQGYKPKKTVLPSIKLTNLRSTTPDFNHTFNITPREILTQIDKSISESTNNLRIVKNSEFKYNLPTDIENIKILAENEIESIALKTLEEKISMNSSRGRLILLEKWLTDMKNKYEAEHEAIYTLCLKEIIKEIQLEFINRGKVLAILFEGLKNCWKKQAEDLEKEAVDREKTKFNELSIYSEKLKRDVEFFKIGMDEYLNKYMESDEKLMKFQRENEIYKQILIRFQDEYKLLPIDFSKISELVIEDLADNSRRTQKKIVNQLVPKFKKNVLIQTDETNIVKFYDQNIQVCPETLENFTFFDTTYAENFTQTAEVFKRRRYLNIYRQSSVAIKGKMKFKKNLTVNFQNKFNKNSSGNQENNFTTNTSSSIFLNPIMSPLGKKMIFLNVPSTKKEENKNNETFGSFAHEMDSRVQSVCSCKSSSEESADFTLQNSLSTRVNYKNQKFGRNKSYTPSPHRRGKSLHHRQKVFQRFMRPADEVLNDCLSINIKKLADEANLSAKGLMKTINSMYLSSILKVKRNQFTTFLEHVFSRLSNKYSLKKMREKRLRDLIASSVKYKELQMAKLFLRMIGAGKCIGQSNYSIHAFKILLQVLNFLEISSSGIPITEINGKKMCPKLKAIDCAKEIFSKRFSMNDMNKLIMQIEYHSKTDSYGINKEGIVDYEWLINYMIYSFDFFEKQIISGTRKIIDAVTLNGFAICVTKSELFIALRAIHADFVKFTEEKSMMRGFPFLNPDVPMSTLISIHTIEKFALIKGLFSIKHIEKICKDLDTSNIEDEIERLNYAIGSIEETRFDDSIPKEDFKKKLESLNATANSKLSMIIFKKEISRILISM